MELKKTSLKELQTILADRRRQMAFKYEEAWNLFAWYFIVTYENTDDYHINQAIIAAVAFPGKFKS